MENFNENKSTIPKYLEELVKPAPLSVAKLITAWDGLSIETQIIILDEYVSNYPDKYKSKLCSVAVKSSNKYIKYLGEKIGYETEIYLHDFVYESNILLDESIKHKNSDSVNIIISNPEKFFEEPQFKRVAIIGNYNGNIDKIASIIKYFCEEIRSSDIEIENDFIEILSEYFYSKSFFDNYIKEADYELRDAMNSIYMHQIWMVIKYCCDSVGEQIIEHISRATGKSFIDNSEIFDGVSESLIRFALSKKENSFPRTRNHIIHDKKYSIETRMIAVRYGMIYTGINIWLIDNINSPRNEIVEIMNLLSFSQESYPTALCVACDLLEVFFQCEDQNDKIESKKYLIDAKNRFTVNIKNRISEMPYSEKRKVLNVIRIYKIAVWLIPWNSTSVVINDFKFHEMLESLNEVNLMSHKNTFELFCELFRKYYTLWESNSKGIVYLENWWKTDFDSVLYSNNDDNRTSSIIYSR